MNSEEESTDQKTRPLENKSKSAGKAGNTNGFRFTFLRHRNHLLPTFSPVRAAKSGGPRGTCPSLHTCPVPWTPGAAVGTSLWTRVAQKQKGAWQGSPRQSGEGKSKTVFWLGKKKQHPGVLTHITLRCLELTDFITANISHGSDDQGPWEKTSTCGRERPFLHIPRANPHEQGGWSFWVPAENVRRTMFGGRSLRLTHRMKVCSTVTLSRLLPNPLPHSSSQWAHPERQPRVVIQSGARLSGFESWFYHFLGGHLGPKCGSVPQFPCL